MSPCTRRRRRARMYSVRTPPPLRTTSSSSSPEGPVSHPRRDRLGHPRHRRPAAGHRSPGGAVDRPGRGAAITGPAEYGGTGLTSVHELVYAGIEAEYSVPDTGVLSVIGLGMIGPTILTHGTPEVRQRYLPGHVPRRRHRLPAVQRAGRRLRPGRVRPGHRLLP